MSSNIGNSILEYFPSSAGPRIKLQTMHILVEIIAMILYAIIAGADDWVEVTNQSSGGGAHQNATWALIVCYIFFICPYFLFVF